MQLQCMTEEFKGFCQRKAHYRGQTMKVVPEINIMNGHCVKQMKGSNHYSELISHSPRKIAKMWEEQGASYLHIRDLDGLMAGHIRNQEAIKKLIHDVSIPVEIYGGIYSLKEVENALNLGARRVVLGLNYNNQNFLKEAVASFGTDKIALNLKSYHGLPADQHREKLTSLELQDTMKRVLSFGVTNIELEDVLNDPYSFVPNFEYLAYMVQKTDLNFMVSGGITTIKQLESLHTIGVAGVILDDVLYERRIDLNYAIELFDKGANVYEL